MECSYLDIIPSRKIVTIPKGTKIIELNDLIKYPIYSINRVFTKEVIINPFRLINMKNNDILCDWADMYMELTLKQEFEFMQNMIMESDPQTNDCREILAQKYSQVVTFINNKLEGAAIEFEEPFGDDARLALNGYRVINVEGKSVNLKYM